VFRALDAATARAEAARDALTSAEATRRMLQEQLDQERRNVAEAREELVSAVEFRRYAEGDSDRWERAHDAEKDRRERAETALLAVPVKLRERASRASSAAATAVCLDGGIVRMWACVYEVLREEAAEIEAETALRTGVVPRT
jgi:hypothetical protein